MNYTYQQTTDPISGNTSPTIRRIEDGASIPPDPNNADYQRYLEWLDDGNKPQPA